MSNTTFNEEIESWYRNWMKAKGKAGPAVTVNILDMLKDFASQYQPTPSKELKSADADNLSIDELLSEFKRHGFDTSNWDGDEGAEKAIVYGVKNHISQLRPVSKSEGEVEFLFTQFPGKDGSQITNDTSEEELEFFMGKSKKEIVLENKDVWEWVVIFYGALKELVELKELKETLYKGNHDGKEYAERKPLAWHAARQAVELWKKSNYGALPPSPTPAVTEAVFTREDMEDAVDFGYRQNVLNGCINFADQKAFINSKTKNNEQQ